MEISANAAATTARVDFMLHVTSQPGTNSTSLSLACSIERSQSRLQTSLGSFLESLAMAGAPLDQAPALFWSGINPLLEEIFQKCAHKQNRDGKIALVVEELTQSHVFLSMPQAFIFPSFFSLLSLPGPTEAVSPPGLWFPTRSSLAATSTSQLSSTTLQLLFPALWSLFLQIS